MMMMMMRSLCDSSGGCTAEGVFAFELDRFRRPVLDWVESAGMELLGESSLSLHDSAVVC